MNERPTVQIQVIVPHQGTSVIMSFASEPDRRTFDFLRAFMDFTLAQYDAPKSPDAC